ncbi:MAG: protein glxC [Gammaproteobacteria bacterium]|nr:protein glxC [Gammaproteobacteria bacterium]MYD75088.1 protein glxC [Gammaproteobacteria bacterium]MYJ51514.1 protein glxC [Gammaproteobacteria bacterium]
MEFDLAETGVRELNRFLHDTASSGSRVEVGNPSGRHNIAVGAMHGCTVRINGHVGYYCAGMNRNADIVVRGNAGPGLAENMMSGTVRVQGNASQYCGATAHGGLLVVEGDASARCGISLKGLDIVVGGSIGHMSAFMAQTGRLVVCGDAAESLGDSIYEARIYVRGKAAGLGTDCIEKPMEGEHFEELGELLDRAGMSHPMREFRRYGSARRLYNFDVDNASAY